MIQLMHVLLSLPLQVIATNATVSDPVLMFRTDDPMTSAVAYDTEGDAAVELVQLGSYGPSVLRRLTPTGQPGEIIWRTDGETLCPGAPCPVGLEYSDKLEGYIVKVAVGTSRWQSPHVYFVTRGDKQQRLIARLVVQPRPDYPEKDVPPPGVAAFSRIESAGVANDSDYVLINGVRQGDDGEIRSYALELGSNRPLERLEGRVLGRTSEGLLVTPDTKGWKRLEKEPAREQEISLTRSRLIPVTDGDVLRVVQSGDRRAELHRTGKLVVYRAVPQGPSSDLQRASAGSANLTDFRGCGTDTPTVTGVWPTKRGTFMVAVDSAFNREQNGNLVYRGRAHCLYEVR